MQIYGNNLSRVPCVFDALLLQTMKSRGLKYVNVATVYHFVTVAIETLGIFKLIKAHEFFLKSLVAASGETIAMVPE